MGDKVNDTKSGPLPDPIPAPAGAPGNAPCEEWDQALFARRPVQPSKVGYGQQWLHYLLFISVAITAWVLLKPSVGLWLWPKAGAAELRRAEAFVAIAYDGISRKDGEVSPELFREHLMAMRAAGYVPITLSDVEGLICRGRPVPQKAVLVTMDQSRKTSYFTTFSILRRFGWNTVMFLWTKPIVDGDSAAMLWPYLGNMVGSGLWEIGAQSHDGFRRVITSPKGLLGGFMTSPIWNSTEQRYESLEEFQQRLKDDHDQCLAQIKHNLGIKPLAYAFPYGNFGQFQHRSIMTQPVNLGLVAERYPLAFILGNLALNTRNSDPHRLNRLHVKPAWSGRELVAHLENSWPKSTLILEKKGEPLASAWVVDWGRLSRDSKGGLILSAATNATGAKMWLAGSDLLADINAKIRFRLENGQFGLYFRASADDQSYVYLGLNEAGEVCLGQKKMDVSRLTLTSSHVALSPQSEHILEVFLRNQYVSASLDGQELFHSRNLLREDLRPGLIGVSVWSPSKGVARARLNGMEVRPLTPTVACWAPGGEYESHALKWIADNSFRLTDLSPKWLDAAAPGSQSAGGLDLGFYRQLAKVHHLRLIPQVAIADERDMLRITPTVLAERVDRARLEGVLINFAGMRSTTMQTLAAWLRPCAAALAESGVKLLVRLPSSFESRTQLGALLAVLPGIQVAAEAGSQLQPGQAGSSSRVVRAETVPEPEPDEALPLFYMIPPAGKKGLIESDEAKCSRLEREGMAAYLDGQYERAVELWREWKRLEPDSPKACMLVGDALSRKGDLADAVAEYDASLELEPGQFALAIRRAEIYSAQGQPQRTLESLNLYARLFPDNVEILLAQARWLGENGRRDEAVTVARRLVEMAPDNVNALALLVRLTPLPEEHRKAMARLVDAGANPKNHMALGEAVWKFALTAQPGAEALNALVESIAEKTTDSRVWQLYGRIKPQTRTVTEKMNGAPISTNRWWVDGGTLTVANNGGTVFAAETNRTEGTLRLLGTLRLRNSFVETLVGKTRGSFWLYICRTPEHMARFGWADDGYLRLQTWSGNRLMAERKLEYKPAAGPVRLRLEARADGIMGYLNGKPAFAECLLLPPDMCFGWLGLAVHSIVRGQASAEFSALSAGPLPMRLGVLLAGTRTEPEADAQLNAVRQDVAHLTAICPAGSVLQADGSWNTLPGSERDINKLFARYYRLWLIPVVECEAPAALKPELFETRAQQTGADGFVLMFKEWPGDRWVASLAQAMKESSLRLVVASMNASNAVTRIQPVARGAEFTAGAGESSSVRFIRRSGAADDAVLAGQEPLLIAY